MDAYVGEIRLLPYTFSPLYWAPCQGQLLSINSNQALYSILGTQYGGNGATTFGLPNLQNFAAVGAGAAPGLTPYAVGQISGFGAVSLTTQQIPSHTHVIQAGNATAAAAVNYSNTPGSGVMLTKGTGPSYTTFSKLYSPTSDHTTLAPNTIGPPIGATGAPHDNHQPYLALQYCICLQGIYPTRS